MAVLAVDRDILTRYITALGETPAYALIPPVMLGTAARTPPDAAMTQAARVAEAQRLYAESGYSRDAPLEIELRYNTSTPHRFLEAFDGASPTNWTGYGDAAFSRSLAAARATPDPALRMQRFVDAETRLLQSQPILPIYFYVSKHLVRDEVEGFVANPLDRHPSRWMRLRAVKP